MVSNQIHRCHLLCNWTLRNVDKHPLAPQGFDSPRLHSKKVRGSVPAAEIASLPGVGVSAIEK